MAGKVALPQGVSPIAFTDYISRTGAAAELPDQIVSELIDAVTQESVILTMAHKVPTTTRDSRIPVVDTLPAASWVTGTDPDTGLKSVSSMAIGNKQIIAEELATIAVIPQNVVDDSEYDVWAAVKPALSQAIARAYDAAVMFGVNAPTTFPPSLVTAATTAGTVVTADVYATATDNPQLVLNAASLVAGQGYNVNAVAVAPGWEFRVGAHRTNVLTNNPVGADTPFPLLLAGLKVRTKPLYWPPPATAPALGATDAIVADWNLVLAGIRKDITLEAFNQGVITDATGKVVQNLMQNDLTAVRATFRAGYYLATPPTGYTVATPCPVGLVKNSGTSFVPHVAVAAAEEESSGQHAARRK
jgi:hypothetical protein